MCPIWDNFFTTKGKWHSLPPFLSSLHFSCFTVVPTLNKLTYQLYWLTFTACLLSIGPPRMLPSPIASKGMSIKTCYSKMQYRGHFLAPAGKILNYLYSFLVRVPQYFPQLPVCFSKSISHFQLLIFTLIRSGSISHYPIIPYPQDWSILLLGSQYVHTSFGWQWNYFTIICRLWEDNLSQKPIISDPLHHFIKHKVRISLHPSTHVVFKFEIKG